MASNPTQLLAVIGNPISHSASPSMHNSMIKHLSLDACYLPLCIQKDRFDDGIKGLIATNFSGFNVTVPFKETIIPLLDWQDDESKKIGAVNTVLIKDNKLYGYNTDGKGFIYSIAEQHSQDLSDKHLSILGAGGTAKALALKCLEQGITSLSIVNRTIERAEALKQNVLSYFPEATITVLSSTTDTYHDSLSTSDIVINTTPNGMPPNENTLPVESLTWMHDKQCIYDVIYNPKQTRFLAEAERVGAKTINGSGMLAAQAMFAFKLFTGKEADFDLMLSKVYNV